MFLRRSAPGGDSANCDTWSKHQASTEFCSVSISYEEVRILFNWWWVKCDIIIVSCNYRFSKLCPLAIMVSSPWLTGRNSQKSEMGLTFFDFWTTKSLPALYFWSHDRHCLCSRSRVVYWSRSGIRDCLCLHSGLFVVILVPLRRDEVSFECKKILKIESAFPLCHHICNYKADGNGKMSPGPRAAWCSTSRNATVRDWFMCIMHFG